MAVQKPRKTRKHPGFPIRQKGQRYVQYHLGVEGLAGLIAHNARTIRGWAKNMAQRDLFVHREGSFVAREPLGRVSLFGLPLALYWRESLGRGMDAGRSSTPRCEH